MKAVVYDSFASQPSIQNLPDPTPTPNSVVIKVMASGVCRSDWHGWMGHDKDIQLPHVPGHELAGIIESVGSAISNWAPGDRVTVPFVGGCGCCSQCHSGNQQICDTQFQPGFTHWGSFAEYVRIDYADTNLVRLPEEMDFTTAASLGCRFVTAFRAIVDQGKVSAGQWVAIHGCGGVGLSAIMIANALGANVIAIDIDDKKLQFAKQLGAINTINSIVDNNVIDAVKHISGSGAHVSIDALGHSETCFNSISNLRKRGKHIQVGLMVEEHARPAIPMDQLLSNELEIIGSHGMQAFRYDAVFAMLRNGKIQPEKLLGKTINLEQSIDVLTGMDSFEQMGITVINQF